MAHLFSFLKNIYFISRLQLASNTILISSVQHSGRHLYNLQSDPLINLVLTWHIHSYENIIDYIPYALFCNCQFVPLNPLPFSLAA